MRTCSLASALVLLTALMAGCASGPNRAPVEDRRPVVRAPVAAAPAAATASAAASAPAAEPARPAPPPNDNAGKPGYYTVKPGDVLVRIALENGQNWRDVQRWNNLENPNLIEVGQVLRVAPPAPDPAAAAARPVTPAGRVESRPLDGRSPVAGAASAPQAGAASAASGPAPVAAAPAVPAPATPAPRSAPAREGDDEIQFLWPAAGPVATGFEEGRSKGVAITGKAGDPVLAAADGRVVYAGSGLRGYGNLVIVKHNATYLTAYAHNQTLLVKDEQVVRKGQKIAEMGASDADRVQLHFEVRRLGVPIDPMRVLPAR
ncbi:MAG: peptidoglycan DD-metalloendopeptidase family protein [Rubrivivax sp.]